MTLNFVKSERRSWSRFRTHTVIFDHEPEFERLHENPDGEVTILLRVWVADALPGNSILRYLGAVRRSEHGRWISRRELYRLFRHATVLAQDNGMEARPFRSRLSSFLRSQQS